MKGLFELLKKRIGFSRIGRISLSTDSKKYISTPNIIIPINKILMNEKNFIEEFEENWRKKFPTINLVRSTYSSKKIWMSS